jgi:hypothetical protein
MVTREPRLSTFAVTAVIGRRITSWPFGRLDICREFVRVRGFGRKERPVPRGAVIRITCERTLSGQPLMWIDDVAGNFHDTRLELATGSARIMDELRACGYPVEAVDRWLRLRVPWSRRGWSPPPEPPQPRCRR